METQLLLQKSKSSNSFFLRMMMVVIIIVSGALISNAYGCLVTGNTLVCAGSTGNVYSSTAGQAPYVWSVTGGTITLGQGTSSITVTWNAAGLQTVSVVENDGSCSTLVVVIPLPTPTISGNNNLCVGTSGVVYTTQAGMSNYAWTVSAGGNITAGGSVTDNTVTVTWNTAGAQTVSVNYANAFNCTASSPTVYNVTVNPLPSPTITGPASVCVGSAGNVYFTEGGMTNYTWTVSAGGTITGGSTTDAITVTWTTTGAKTITVNYTNEFGCITGTPGSYSVTVNALPSPSLSGNSSVCLNSAGNLYTTQSGGGIHNYIWSVLGGSITAGGTGTDNTVTVNWTSVGSGSVSVNYTNNAGCTAASPTVYGVTVNALPNPSYSRSNTCLCQLDRKNLYHPEWRWYT